MIIPFHYFTQIIIPLFLLFIIPTSAMQTFQNHTLSSMPGPQSSTTTLKKLRRLPHVFSKVLEITPFTSDADVYVQEHHDCFIFVAKLDDQDVINGEVKVRVVEIHPGITKVVINVTPSSMDELNLDVWRFRLPGSARPELATVVYAHGELVVTVPKIGWGENIRKGSGGGDCKGGFKGNIGNLIPVQ